MRLVLPLLALGFTVKIASAQLYEADTSSGRILEFTPAGIESTFASDLSAPVGVALDAAGNLFVSASGSGKIVKFTPGAVKTTFASGLSKPWGLAFDASGNIFVSASGSGQISKFTPAGVETAFATGLNQPMGLAFDAFGNLFVGTSTGVAGAGEVLKFTPSGTESIFATGLFDPTSLAFGSGGNLYVADHDDARIYRFTPRGVKSTFASGPTFGLAFDAFGDLFSSDGASDIREFAPGGAEAAFANGLSHSGMLAFAPFTSLDNFIGPDGAYPAAALVQATNGYLYGTTPIGGAYGGGTIFAINPGGAGATVYSFCALQGCADGSYPIAGLVQATDGNLYGTTSQGGHGYDSGSVFKMTPSGTLTSLYTFCTQSGCPDGENPAAGLVQANDGDLYGTTFNGGAYGGGTIFRITPSGKLTTLYSFCSQKGCPDGERPQAGLVQASNGDLYGTASGGGPYGYGTVFKITLSGTLTTLYRFCSQPACKDGGNPSASLVQATNGDLYGTTMNGGAHTIGGTIFKITPSGTLNTLYSFCPQCVDGESPQAALIQATDGDLYGTTSGLADGFHATIFKITPSGSLTTLYSFCPAQTECGTDGPAPIAGLIQDTNGDLYGTTSALGTELDGTIFKLSVGLNAFVKTLPASGRVGEPVQILGNNLTSASSVTFNGIAAAFTIGSSSEISATVPAGATTGKVEVITPGGTLSSNLPFRVP